MKINKKRKAINIPKPLFDELKLYCDVKGYNMSKYLVRLAKEEIANVRLKDEIITNNILERMKPVSPDHLDAVLAIEKLVNDEQSNKK